MSRQRRGCTSGAGNYAREANLPRNCLLNRIQVVSEEGFSQIARARIGAFYCGRRACEGCARGECERLVVHSTGGA
jgi:hypothetical protein